MKEVTTMAEKTVPSLQQETAPRREETRAEGRYITPPVDIFETKEGLTLLADLPGVEQGSLDVRVADGVLTLQARSAHVAPGTPITQEYELLHFFRQFELPEAVDSDKIRAELKHGVLALHLPKKEKAKPRQIEVQVA
ncbi:MAG: Hsp20/alpha crystallin family protein [Candidatus Methylomirabilales bacterium]